jgi:hypothetical protein
VHEEFVQANNLTDVIDLPTVPNDTDTENAIFYCFINFDLSNCNTLLLLLISHYVSYPKFQINDIPYSFHYLL